MMEPNPHDAGKLRRWVERALKGQNPSQVAQGELSAAEQEVALSFGPMKWDLLLNQHPETVQDFLERVEAAEAGAKFTAWADENA